MSQVQLEWTDGQKLQQSATGSSLSFTWMGIKKTVKGGQRKQAAEVFGAEEQAISFAKNLINTKNTVYRSLTRLRSQLRTHWVETTLPWIEDGVRLIRHKSIVSFRSEHEEIAGEFLDAVKVFALRYEDVLDEARVRLGELWDEDDYPKQVGDLFKVELGWPNLQPPEYLKHADPAYFQELQNKRLAEFEKAVRLGEQMLAKELSDMVDHLRKVLAPNPDGSKKRFKDSTVEKFHDFFLRCKELNPSESGKLQEVVAQAEKVLGNVDPEDLRLDEGFRLRLGEELAGVGKMLEESVELAPKRLLGKRKKAGAVAPEPGAPILSPVEEVGAA